MRDVHGKKISINSRVVLVSPRYGSSPSNPLQGTSHECLGTYFEEGRVKWDNGTVNCYGDKTLKMVSGCISIWD